MTDWRTTPFPDCLVQHEVNRHNQLNSSEMKLTGRFPVVDQGQCFIAGYTDNEEKVVRHDLPYVIFGDHTRCFKFVDFPFVLGADGTKVLKPNEIIFDPKFFYFALLSLNIPSRGYNRHFKLLKESLILHPIEKLEQKKIAALLSMVQGTIEQQEHLIASTMELKKALMHKLFTEGTRGEGQKETEIGPVPESWEVVRGRGAFEIKQGQVDPKEVPFKNMLHLGPENIEAETGRASELHTNAELGISSGNYHFTEENIVYSKIRPYLNKVFLPTIEGTCSADMYPLRPFADRFSKEFLFQYLLSSGFVKQAMSYQDRTGIPKINRGQLFSIYFPKPLLEEQQEIAECLAIYDSKIDIHVNARRNLSDLFRTLLHQLMTAKIQVNDLDLSELGHEAVISGLEEVG